MAEAAASVFTVEMGEELYSIVAPDGTTGEPVPYEVTATVMYNGILHYAIVDNPDDFPEGGDPPTVFRVDSTTVVESTMEEVSDEDEGGGGGSGSGDEEEDEEEEDEEDEDEEAGPGDVIEFPDPEEEEEDENLPRAE